MGGNNAQLRALLDDITSYTPAAEANRAPDSSNPTAERPAPRLAESWRAVLGEQRAARLDQRARQLVPELAERPSEELRADRDAGRDAFAALNAAAAAQAGRLEGAAAAAAERARTSRTRQDDIEAQLRHATRPQARHLQQVARTADAGAQRAEREQATTAGQLDAMREHDLHPDQWLDASGDAAARGVAAAGELEQRQELTAEQDSEPPLHERERPAPVLETPGRALAPEVADATDVGYEM